MKNTQFLLAKRPVGTPTRENWDQVECDIPELGQNQVLVKIAYISLDPAMRGWMNDGKSYIAPVKIGEVMRASTVGEVISSTSPDYHEGDYVFGHGGVQQFAVSDAKDLHKIDVNIAPLERYLGVLGMPGMTAYFGLLNTGQPKEGETVVVSGAAGAVGTVVGQIAKLKGCTVIGIAGGKDKCQYLVDELGFDGAIDYKSENVKKALKTHCPKGVDVYFDNVGGEILDDVLTQIRMHARIVICGAISQYNNTTAVKGPSNYLSLLVNRARMEGIVVFDNVKHYGEAAEQMAKWIAEGKLKAKEHVVKGIEHFPETLLMLFNGENTGKLVLKVDDE
ncbi:MAG: NADP-dependent oxidoreductase [Alteromonadaceae bacterium]|uniref:NADP-dependent oxidoreductase n=1 Tax=Paraglaciecola chathamensis TaxID=368405 RepID=UPI000C35315C|nr:NADP-dependent oxidoreductase [Paraglaciecola agarilytica]MBN24058.1 NADP-dependent oxidoreductase [Alteromonadaceae bacterium]|tara:strand:- start:50468 stop:51472 length:1005 start_codon:yes stop_codon:yes gene_type:complete